MQSTVARIILKQKNNLETLYSLILGVYEATVKR